MKKYLLYTVFIATLSMISFSSCEDAFGDFLEKQPSNELTEEEVFSSWKNTEAFYYDGYNFLRNGIGRINNSWMDAATDLAETSYSWGGTRSSFNIGNYYASSGAAEINDTWATYYRVIRKLNLLLERIDNVPLGAEENATERKVKRNRIVEEARVLRAYFYWELTLRYGAVPIITNSLDPLADDSNITRPESEKECFQFVIDELESVGSSLWEDTSNALDDPTSVAANDYGRITRGMQRALLCRIKLYLASPRYQSLGLSTWQDAADEAEAFIKIYGHKGNNRYNLQTNPDAPKGYQQAITTRVVDGNSETIFWRNDAQGDWFKNEAPVGYGGNGGLCPSQNLVDMYDMSDGSSPFSSYDATGAPIYDTNGNPSVNSSSGYDDQNPYANRDPRFYMTVLYNGAMWWSRSIDTTVGGTDNPTGNANATPTGYYNRKYMDDTQTHPVNGGTMYRNWIFIRYAEILLNYAEAKNEISGPNAEVFEVLQILRSRVGMTARIADRTDLQNKDNLRNFIRKERTIELAFEDHRWWDVRRWNVAEVALSRPIYGMTITKSGTQLIYMRKIAQKRVFEQKMYLYPIPEAEVWKTGMKNNPGWE